MLFETEAKVCHLLMGKWREAHVHRSARVGSSKDCRLWSDQRSHYKDQARCEVRHQILPPCTTLDGLRLNQINLIKICSVLRSFRSWLSALLIVCRPEAVFGLQEPSTWRAANVQIIACSCDLVILNDRLLRVEVTAGRRGESGKVTWSKSGHPNNRYDLLAVVLPDLKIVFFTPSGNQIVF